jgi:hypothetical protein
MFTTKGKERNGSQIPFPAKNGNLFKRAFADPSRRSGQALMVGATRKLGNDWLLDFRFSNFDFPVAFDDFLDPPASGEFLI